MNGSGLKRRLPDYIATGLCVLVTSWWTAWGAEEMFFAGGELRLPVCAGRLNMDRMKAKP